MTGPSVNRPLSKRDKKKRKRIQKDLKRLQKKKETQSIDEKVLEERRARAATVSASRILTDKDFSKIDAAQVKKQIEVKKKKRRAEEMEDNNKR